MKKVIGKMLYILVLVIILTGIVKLYGVYQTNNFNAFVKTEYVPYTSSFTRDDEIKYSAKPSYCITSKKENDAMFYEKITVEKNTPYRVTCKIKTKEVTTIKQGTNAGAQISVADTVEKSKSITGTNDWQEVELIFNSKDRTSVEIGFRLGGYDDNCTGTAWFSDFKIEAGTQSKDNKWKFACFIFENTDVTLQANGSSKEVKLTMTDTDKQDMKQNMARFKTSCQELSQNKMTAEYETITIQTPITALSYDAENGYYVAPQNVENIIAPYLEGKDYDHIFVAVRLGDRTHQSDIEVNDWIGLGGMDYLGVGFSNIRLPNSDQSYIYKYDERINTFPEEVFIHEFLHTLERNAKEYGFSVPELHAYADYGYQDEKKIGQKKWYEAYMNQTIQDSNGQAIGLDANVYTLKPNHEKDFEFTYTLKNFQEPKNIIEEIQQIIEKIIENVGKEKEGSKIT